MPGCNIGESGQSSKLENAAGIIMMDLGSLPQSFIEMNQRKDKGNVICLRQNVTTADRWDILKLNLHSRMIRREKYSSIRHCLRITGLSYQRQISYTLSYIYNTLLA